jgi:hypothetical protein
MSSPEISTSGITSLSMPIASQVPLPTNDSAGLHLGNHRLSDIYATSPDTSIASDIRAIDINNDDCFGFELIRRLLLARQNARMSDVRSLYTIEPLADSSSFCVKFDGQLIPGLQFFQFERETDIDSSYKICAYGCVKGGKHQHLHNTEYFHLFPLI